MNRSSTGYARYPAYRNTEIAWVQMIPNHWKTYRAKSIFNRVRRPTRASDGIVTAFRDGQVTLRSNRRIDGFTNAAKEIGYQGVRKGDLVVHAMDGFAGAIGVSDSNGKCSPVCSVCVPKNTQQLDVSYFGYLVRQLAVTGFIASLAKGIRERSTEFRFSEFSVLPLAVPPIEEQTQIVRFLDHETAKIDALIEKQQQLIALLEEKRQAVISHAVTKGLDPDVPMRDSGVEWLGEVPAHWKTGMKILRAADGSRGCFVNGPFGSDLLASELQEEGVPVIYIRDIKPGIYSRKSTVCVSPRKATQLAICRVAPGDVLVSKVGDPPGDACVYPRDGEAAIITQDVIRIRVDKENVDPDFLAAVLNSTYGRTAIEDISVESTRKRVSLGDFKQFRFALPPLPEQIEISSAAKKKWASFGRLINSAQMGVDLLQEKRAALISAAVTGKIDVRGWKPPESTSETTNGAEAP